MPKCMTLNLNNPYLQRKAVFYSSSSLIRIRLNLLSRSSLVNHWAPATLSWSLEISGRGYWLGTVPSFRIFQLTTGRSSPVSPFFSREASDLRIRGTKHFLHLLSVDRIPEDAFRFLCPFYHSWLRGSSGRMVLFLLFQLRVEWLERLLLFFGQFA